LYDFCTILNLANVTQYIHANHVHNKFTDDMYSWEWSSYHSILSTKKTQVLRAEVIELFGGKAELIKIHLQQYDFKLALEMEF